MFGSSFTAEPRVIGHACPGDEVLDDFSRSVSRDVISGSKSHRKCAHAEGGSTVVTRVNA